MSADSPIEVAAVPVVPIDYAGPDERLRVLRPIGWLAFAFAASLLVQFVGQTVATAAQYALHYPGNLWSGGLLDLGLPLLRAPLLVWMALAARSLTQGRFTAVRSLRTACLLFTGLMILIAVLGVLLQLVVIATAPRYFWPQMAVAELRILLEPTVPIVVRLLLRDYAQ